MPAACSVRTIRAPMRLPPPAATHKVGESTVEIGSWYLDRTLGLGDLLEQRQRAIIVRARGLVHRPAQALL